MVICDFQRRYLSMPKDEVFGVWYSIHKRIDYANSTWRSQVLDYVFSNAPKPELPEPDGDGLVTLYRGMGEISEPAEQSIAWTTNQINALWFANHSGRGTKLAIARVRPAQIVAAFHTFSNENEVILRPGAEKELRFADMIPALDGVVGPLLIPALWEFWTYGNVARTLGYPPAQKAMETELAEERTRCRTCFLQYARSS